MTKADDIWIWRYRLRLRAPGGWNAKTPGREVEGFLIRTGDGFGCVHPWPELGDAPVNEQLAALRSGVASPLLKRALDCAKADGAARREGRSWWTEELKRKIPASHATVTDPAGTDFDKLQAEGFTTVKLKGGPDFSALLPVLEKIAAAGLRARIDFNGSLTPEAFLEFTTRADALREIVEFVEDPAPWNETSWRWLRRETGWKLALDRLPPGESVAADGGGAWDVRVLKPALEAAPDAGELTFPAVFTSYMDHPVGQLFAVREAARYAGKQREAGLLTHRLLEPDAFTEILGATGPRLTLPPGTGMGFDELLESLPWEKAGGSRRFFIGGRVPQNPRAPLPGPLPELPEDCVGFGTSGSTGEPSIVVHSRASLEASAAAVNQWLGLTAEDVWLRVLPVFHVGGFQIHTRAGLSGSRVVEDDARWNPRRFAETCEAERVTVTSLVPTQVFDLTREGLQAPPCLKWIVVGGGALDSETWRTARKLGWPVLPSYGLTEAASQVATALPGALFSGDHAGEPPDLHLLPCWEARLAPGTEGPDGSGILEIRGPALCRGRYARKDGVWRWEAAPEDGWWRTADRARLEGRRLVFRGRADRTVKVLGELVNLDAVENDLLAAGLPPGRFAVAALPDERAGNRLVLASETDATEAFALYQKRAVPFARLAEWRRVEELPRTALGKIRRGALAERLAAEPARFTAPG